MSELRDSLLNGHLPEDCGTCVQREQSLGTSRRHWYSEKVSEPGSFEFQPKLHLRQMDLNFGNACNLKCRMCGSWGSSLWAAEDRQLNALCKDLKRSSGADKRRRNFKTDAELELMKPMLSKVERLDFKGGEPLLHEDMYSFLGKLIEWGLASQVVLAYTSNGTVFDPRLKELWPKFKQVRLVISLEGTGRLYSYIRGGKLTLDDLDHNLQSFDQIENLHGSYNITIQNYNVFHLGEVLNWIKSRDLKRFDKHYRFDCYVTNPRYLCIDDLPLELKLEAEGRLRSYPHPELEPVKASLRRPAPDPEEAQRNNRLFARFTDELDRLRGEDFLSIVPEFRRHFDFWRQPQRTAQ